MEENPYKATASIGAERGAGGPANCACRRHLLLVHRRSLCHHGGHCDPSPIAPAYFPGRRIFETVSPPDDRMFDRVAAYHALVGQFSNGDWVRFFKAWLRCPKVVAFARVRGKLIEPEETESGSAGTQPDKGYSGLRCAKGASGLWRRWSPETVFQCSFASTVRLSPVLTLTRLPPPPPARARTPCGQTYRTRRA